MSNPVGDEFLARVGFKPNGRDSVIAENCEVRIGVNRDGDGWFVFAKLPNGNYLDVPVLRRNIFTASSSLEEVA